MSIVIISLVLLFGFVTPNYSQADTAGILLDPICELLQVLGDGINWLMSTVLGEKGGVMKYGGDALTYLEQNGTDNTNNLPKETLKIGMDYGADIDSVGTAQIPDIKISPAEIFAGKVALLDANFFNNQSATEYNKTMIGSTGSSAAWNLKPIIASWYQTFRLIAIVGLLSVLVYVAIRIIISSTAGDKAKYKQSLTDWLVALCLIFFLHYLMVFVMTMVSEIQTIILGNNNNNNTVYTTFLEIIKDNNSVAVIKTNGVLFGASERTGNTGNWDVSEALSKHTSPMNYSFQTNLIGYMRMSTNNPDGIAKITYTIMYLALTFYTLYFFFIYMKRMIILTFLTLIAPLVALTYPIDKIKDGKAQAFNYWLREYIVNAMLPVIHLILYTVMVTSAIQLVNTMPIYALCVLAFIVPAEKMIKDMFGIKSNTAPALGGFAGGAIASQAIGKLTSRIAGGKSKGSAGGAGKDAGSDGAGKIHYANSEDSKFEDLLGASNNKDAAGANSRTTNRMPTTTTPQMPEGKIANAKRKIANSPIASVGRNAAGMIRSKYKIPKGSKGLSVVAKRLGKGGARFGIRAAATLAGASIGLAGGIVGGNLSDMWKGMAAGTVTGGAFGEALADKAETLGGVGNFSDRLFKGEEAARDIANEKSFMNDYNNISYMEQHHPEMSSKDIQDKLRAMEKYRATGATEMKELERMQQMEEAEFSKNIASGNFSSEDEARKIAQNKTMQTGKLSKQYADQVFRDKQKGKAAEDALAKRMQDAMGINKKQAADNAKETFENIRILRGEKKRR